jgi:ribosomal protein S18 acetylase RimI-like enzyme
MTEATGAAGFEPLLEHLERLDGLDARLGGGWGIDVLAGRVSRPHHDTDLFLPRGQLPAGVSRFTAAGFVPVLEEPGARTVLQAPDGRRVDLNGLTYRPDGHAVQSDAGGDFELFPRWGWTSRRVGNRPVVCLTAEAQRLKHRGYPPRPQDAADLRLIEDIDEPAHFDPTVRAMESSEADLIAGIETASDRLLEPFGLWPLPSSPRAAKQAEVARTTGTLVAGRPPFGFARLEQVDGHAHLGQLSVLAEYGRLGVGRALVEAACDVARRRGDRLITLTTFADVPFNAAWYRRLGFEDMPEPLSPDLAQVVADESELATRAPRVTMGRRLA